MTMAGMKRHDRGGLWGRFWAAVDRLGEPKPRADAIAFYKAVRAWQDRYFTAEHQVSEWRSRALAAEAEVARLKDERLKLDRRIHNQRASLRQTWEIVEMRRNYMGSPASRAAFARLLRRHKELLAKQQNLGTEFQKVLEENRWGLYAR